MTLRAPLIRPPETQLRQLMQALEIDFVRLTEHVVSPGWRLAFGGSDVASVHYHLAGLGKVAMEGQAPIVLEPHALVIIPSKKPFRFEVDGPQGTLTTLNLRRPTDEVHGTFHRFEAGEGDPRITLICGSFKAHHGAQQDMFGNLQRPIIEQFTPQDRLDEHMKDVFAELLKQEQAGGAMAACLLKQVVV